MSETEKHKKNPLIRISRILYMLLFWKEEIDEDPRNEKKTIQMSKANLI